MKWSIDLTVFAGLGLVSTYVYWLLRVQRPGKRRKMLQKIGDARSKLSARELRKASVEFMDRQNLVVGGDMRITSTIEFEHLRSLLFQAAVKAQDVHELFRCRATLSHNMTQCLVGFIADASLVAKSCDEAVHSNKPLGPLHGIPISVKESVKVKGHDSTIGLASRCGRIAGHDSAIVQAIKDAGGVPFCRTNIPQTNLSYGCSNPIFGATVNPYNPSRVPGGSSGGEAALISTGGSLIGIGTDIGGSIRVPAAFCGVCGFKPTGGRISTRGVATVVKGQTGVAAAVGVIAKKISAIAVVMDALTVDPSGFDPLLAPIPWNQFGELSSARKLRAGYYYADGFLAAIPANVRAVKEACELFRGLGHEVVPFEPPGAIEGIHLFLSLLTADGAAQCQAALQYEEADPSCKAFLDSVRSKNSYSSFMEPWLLRRAGKRRAAALFENFGNTSVSDYWRLQAAKTEYRRRWCSAMQVAGIDVLLCPSHAMVAPAPEVVATSGATLCYTQIFNLLDFPAAVVPMGLATKEDEAAMSEWPTNVLEEQFGSRLPDMLQDSRVYGQQDDTLELAVRKTCKDMAGLPLSVQVVGPPFHDEKVLRAAQELQEAAPPMPAPPVADFYSATVARM